MMLYQIMNGLSMTLRVMAIVIGGYVFTGGVAALSGMLLHAIGVPLSDAMLTTILLGYIFYTAIVMWGFADRQSVFRPMSISGAAVLSMIVSSYFAPGVLGL